MASREDKEVVTGNTGETGWIQESWSEIERCQEQLQSVQDVKERVKVLYSIAELYNKVKEHEEADKYGEILYQLCRDNNLKEEYARVLYLIGLNKFSMDRYATALEYYYEALPMYKKYFSNKEIGMLLNEIGRNYSRVHDREKEKQFYQEAIQYYSRNAKYYSNLGATYLELRDQKNALLYFHKAEELAEETGDAAARGQNYANLGNYHYERSEIELAMENFEKACQIFKDMGWKNFMVQVQIEKGKLQYEMGMTELALSTLLDSITIARQVGRDVLVARCYQYISKIYEDQGATAKALKYIHLYTDIYERYYSEELFKKVGELNSKYELSKREIRRKRMLDKASHLASVGVMTAGITHEINQPLNAIKICADSILYSEEMSPGTIPETYLEDIEQISKGVQRIEDIIKHLRSYWEMNSDEDVEEESVDMHEGVNSVLDLMKRQLISHGIELQSDFWAEDIEICCSKIKLEQIIINLINNSLQALDSCHRSGKYILIRTEQKDNNWAELEICDNGTGIKPEIFENIFDPFFTTKHPGKGMGLGLAIVKEIVENLNGTIEVKNNITEGVCFIVRFRTRS